MIIHQTHSTAWRKAYEGDVMNHLLKSMPAGESPLLWDHRLSPLMCSNTDGSSDSLPLRSRSQFIALGAKQG